jgi:hypothetical protein
MSYATPSFMVHSAEQTGGGAPVVMPSGTDAVYDER